MRAEPTVGISFQTPVQRQDFSSLELGAVGAFTPQEPASGTHQGLSFWGAHCGCHGGRAAGWGQGRGAGAVSLWMSSEVHQDRRGAWTSRLPCVRETFSLAYYTCQRPSRKQTVAPKGVSEVSFKRDHLQGRLR